MVVTELDTFVQKFHQLWNAGLNAHLNLDTHAGSAWVSLHVQLGHLPGPPHLQPHPPFYPVAKKVASPSRQRRQDRRAAARKADAEKADTVEETAHEIVHTENVENPENLENGNETVNEKASLQDSEEIMTTNNNIEKPNLEEILENETEEVPALEIEEVSAIGIEKKSCDAEQNDNEKDLSTTPSIEPKLDTTVTESIPPIVTIDATSIFDDSPNHTLMNDEVDSLVRFLTNKEHLSRNICNIEYSHLSSREVSTSKYKHTVGLKIQVRAGNLWEGPRSYLWKHIGQDTWSRGNGTSINVVRIHQK